MKPESTERFFEDYKKKGLTQDCISRFRNMVYGFYRLNARDDLPWRNTDNPYHILVSEIMLQQTQVERVLHKYPLFIKRFPDFMSLSRAPLRSIYSVWQGMGYNRRAPALQKIARMVQDAPYHGSLPSSMEELQKFPFIGRSTAGAVAAFAFHQPAVFIETNIRRVFIHFFFRESRRITDRNILPHVEKTLDRKDPRSWYYALMDYGSYLGSRIENPNTRSSLYRKQGQFEGSVRQLRGQILNLLMQHQSLSCREITKLLGRPFKEVSVCAARLYDEGFIRKTGQRFVLK